jgi:hypothetical protein
VGRGLWGGRREEADEASNKAGEESEEGHAGGVRHAEDASGRAAMGEAGTMEAGTTEDGRHARGGDEGGVGHRKPSPPPWRRSVVVHGVLAMRGRLQGSLPIVQENSKTELCARGEENPGCCACGRSREVSVTWIRRRAEGGKDGGTCEEATETTWATRGAESTLRGLRRLTRIEGVADEGERRGRLDILGLG